MFFSSRTIRVIIIIINNNNNNNNYLISTKGAVHTRVRDHCNAWNLSISNWLVIDRPVDYTETCTLLGSPAGLVGTQME